MKEKKDIVIKSKITGITYNDNLVVHIWNVLQSYKFLVNGATLVDLFPGHMNGEERICFVFYKEDFDKLQPLWVDHRL